MNVAKLLVALFFLAAVAQAGDLYKWTDNLGVLHYSDIPPPSTIKAQRVHVNSGVTSDDTAQDAGKPAKDAKADAKPEPAKPPIQPLAQTAEYRARVCDQSKANLELLESKFQVADAQGKPLDAQGRAAFIAQSKRSVATNCGAAAH
ncbi:MAG: DUF4124 domain-containing protein [Rudaea sp.]